MQWFLRFILVVSAFFMLLWLTYVLKFWAYLCVDTGQRLVERDYELLREIERWRFCLGRHIRVLAGFASERTCDRRLKMLKDEAKYIDKKYILFGVPALYTLTHKGKTVIGANHRLDKIRVDRITHDIAVLDTVTYFILKSIAEVKQITTEKQLYSKNGFSIRKHYPDFVIETKNEKICVELELSAKGKSKFSNNLQENFITYDKQIWVVLTTGKKIIKQLEDHQTMYPNIEILYLEEVQNFVKLSRTESKNTKLQQ